MRSVKELNDFCVLYTKNVLINKKKNPMRYKGFNNDYKVS